MRHNIFEFRNIETLMPALMFYMDETGEKSLLSAVNKMIQELKDFKIYVEAK